MSKKVPVGISDIAIFLPRQKITLEAVIEGRAKQENGVKIAKLLKRALHRTGLTSLHFPKLFEDPVTMAAESVHKLIKRKKFSVEFLRYLVSGTETAVDHSKPIAAYVAGMLKRVGIPVPESISTFQTQHACAGGTVALLSVSALLGMMGPSEESGIVVCTDVARYTPSTSAEVTQGAGSVALLVETDPKLLELDLQSVGYCSNDVDDFFRPLGSTTAKVKGRYSIDCYREAMESAFCDHAKRLGVSVGEVLNNADMFAMHVPYPNLPLETMQYLLNKYAGIDDGEAFLEEKGFYAMTAPAAKSGNIYSGSLFLSLAFLLKDRYEKFGEDLVGKSILLASYGSGNTLALISGKIAKGAIDVIANWDLDAVWSKEVAEFGDYEKWIDSEPGHCEVLEPGSFYLNSIREDGYREYLYQK